MHPTARQNFNQNFTEAKYQDFLAYMHNAFNFHINFRIAETPVFIPKALKNKLIAAAEQCVDFITSDKFETAAAGAVPPNCQVPGDEKHAHFLAIDFAICKDKDGEFIPQLIELQGFPSLFTYEAFLGDAWRKFTDVPQNFSNLLDGLTTSQYIALLRKHIVAEHHPENVIILEIEPYKQGTAIDFVCTQELLGVAPICITDVIKEGKKLFYLKNGVKTAIHRIYNRIIFDELLQRNDLKLQYTLTDEVEVEWCGHPNWFFKISKYIMPHIQGEYFPECKFLSDYNGTYPIDLENYVLKPLFSFSGTGVKFHCTQSDIDAIPKEELKNFLLQRKVEYAPAVQAPDGGVKAEVRMLYIWTDDMPRPKLCVNLARLSRGEMIGVKFNKDKTWVGGTIGFFEED